MYYNYGIKYVCTAYADIGLNIVLFMYWMCLRVQGNVW